MNSKHPLILLALVTYIFLPKLFGWITDPAGDWYRPFLIWVLIIIVAYFTQSSKEQSDTHDF